MQLINFYGYESILKSINFYIVKYCMCALKISKKYSKLSFMVIYIIFAFAYCKIPGECKQNTRKMRYFPPRDRKQKWR